MAVAHTMQTLLYLLISTSCLLPKARGHGRLLEPPSRSSMWRLGYETPKNYNDNQLFCGGVGVQYRPGVDGKCGVCGDPWPGPRKNEPGGKFANGIIVRKYDEGQIINVTIELTANHKGYFEFRLCPANSPFDRVKQDCLDKYILMDTTTGQTRRYITADGGYKAKVKLKLKLPKDLTCRACLLQWKYNAGNSWGVGADGKACIGCGNQEQFYGCADITIGRYDDVVVGKPVGMNPWLKEDGSYDYDWDFGTQDNGNGTHGSGSIRIVPQSFLQLQCFVVVFSIIMKVLL